MSRKLQTSTVAALVIAVACASGAPKKSETGARASEVTAPHWASAVAAVRAPLGKLSSRQLHSAEHKTSLPGAPDGEYVVIQFDSVFEHKAHAIETVTPARQPDGTWKVSGYFIK